MDVRVAEVSQRGLTAMILSLFANADSVLTGRRRSFGIMRRSPFGRTLGHRCSAPAFPPFRAPASAAGLDSDSFGRRHAERACYFPFMSHARSHSVLSGLSPKSARRCFSMSDMWPPP